MRDHRWPAQAPALHWDVTGRNLGKTGHGNQFLSKLTSMGMTRTSRTCSPALRKTTIRSFDWVVSRAASGSWKETSRERLAAPGKDSLSSSSPPGARNLASFDCTNARPATNTATTLIGAPAALLALNGTLMRSSARSGLGWAVIGPSLPIGGAIPPGDLRASGQRELKIPTARS